MNCRVVDKTEEEQETGMLVAITAVVAEAEHGKEGEVSEQETVGAMSNG